ncbi:acetyl-CoA carboxylase biotin carboxylase subunit [Candidatus Puniceispirillum marinum]|uniref:biotin carboxylase n=1 Tax=Puniceispirillum marinum (strain IMCC1322) TaxID=488538 RepID=D5BMH4_PUNMI|nr:acetyl-CoA carboxylase biotin carboxylase subunit [Candidatus Puniceispirillum marinum]ADE40017.1 acetyl CoA carboxylase, biotin carboxylase subunit [Candidatus Puniceispirillum marinum IMCC1322]
MKIKKLFIANRGEIAVRIIRAARDLGIETVQAFSTADATALAVELADHAVEIGPAPAAQSYLSGDAIIAAAKKADADAIHPGYGFLSENADFADAVTEAGLIFIGPSGDTIRLMGDKAMARQKAAEAGVPTIPGSDGVLDNLDEAADMAEAIGFPVMIKAAAGGGGRGIRIAENAEDFVKIAAEATSEAKAAFGDGRLYVEKLISNARHVEVQILGDGQRFVHCFERECSLQRRRQKLWEEAPCLALSDDMRDRLCNSAVKLAQAVGYKGAGTIEFLYDDVSRTYYFIEMNTRIQVEHPVTEAITGIDLVAEMIRIASDEPLAITQNDISVNGHAIEVRINAEDPENNFLPFPGIIDDLRVPGGIGIRFDHMLFNEYQIPPFYDSLLGKLIAYGQNREIAIKRLRRALAELRLGKNLKTTSTLLHRLSHDPDVLSGAVHVNWLEPWIKANFTRKNNETTETTGGYKHDQPI